MDKDLEFLKHVDDRYLDVLVDVMINYDGGKGKIKAIKEECAKFGTSYKNYLDDIVDVYMNYGNDAYANVTKGIRNSYRHILSDVCSSFRIEYNNNKSLEENEYYVLKRALSKYEDSWTMEEIINLIKGIYAKPKVTFFDTWIQRMKDDVIIMTMIAPNPLMDLYMLIMDLYQKGKPELQVTIPCTLLIALFRKSVKV